MLVRMTFLGRNRNAVDNLRVKVKASHSIDDGREKTHIYENAIDIRARAVIGRHSERTSSPRIILGNKVIQRLSVVSKVNDDKCRARARVNR